eukprot:3881943-Lingulodinium_polyedra.AAC.1
MQVGDWIRKCSQDAPTTRRVRQRCESYYRHGNGAEAAFREGPRRLPSHTLRSKTCSRTENVLGHC